MEADAIALIVIFASGVIGGFILGFTFAGIMSDIVLVKTQQLMKKRASDELI